MESGDRGERDDAAAAGGRAARFSYGVIDNRAALNDQPNVAALSIFALIPACARGADPATSVSRPSREQTDRLAPLAARAAAGRRRHFFLAELLLQIPVRGDDGVGRSGRSMMMAAAARRRAKRRSSHGVIDNSAALNDQQNVAAVNHIRSHSARARGPTQRRGSRRAAMPTDRLEPAGGACGCWPTSPFLFSGIVVGKFRFGATMELGRSGRSMMMSAAAGGRASAASYGVIATDRQICSH